MYPNRQRPFSISKVPFQPKVRAVGLSASYICYDVTSCLGRCNHPQRHWPRPLSACQHADLSSVISPLKSEEIGSCRRLRQSRPLATPLGLIVVGDLMRVITAKHYVSACCSNPRIPFFCPVSGESLSSVRMIKIIIIVITSNQSGYAARLDCCVRILREYISDCSLVYVTAPVFRNHL